MSAEFYVLFCVTNPNHVKIKSLYELAQNSNPLECYLSNFALNVGQNARYLLSLMEARVTYVFTFCPI